MHRRTSAREARSKRINTDGRLPGERQTDKLLLKEVVHHLNGVRDSQALAAALEVARYILRKFFGASLERYRQRGARHKTFKDLAVRKDLCLSRNYLHFAMAVYEQYQRLPQEVADALTLANHKLLLGAKPWSARSKLAKMAARQGWTRDRLELEIAKHHVKHPVSASRRGRKTIPLGIKRLRTLNKAAIALRDAEIDPHEVDRYLCVEDLERLAKDLASHRERVLDLIAWHQGECA